MKKLAIGIVGVAGTLLAILGIFTKVMEYASFSIIGGADGPTAVFIAGNLGDGFSIGALALGIVMIVCSVLVWRKKLK
ncbi:MAG: oxaloacetate decarboxylase [Lachnospiraceae bacterium]|nr:oxaloacetate decarboxylase [Lachnospiraceae bacterium]